MGRDTRHPARDRRQQRGAALLVAMILIFMLSILGISSMRNSTLEQRITVNSILASDVLQAAESGNELILNDDANLTSAYLAADDRIVIDSPLGEDSPFDTRVVLRYVGEGNAIGASLDASQGAGSFDALRYVATGTATLTEGRASREVDQGAYRNAPSD